MSIITIRSILIAAIREAKVLRKEEGSLRILIIIIATTTTVFI